ncbi:DNA-binding IclR family transcriptional regulator [Sulfitobacter undariae]|uniref:DNA-binding IclR family transcriptional regulator n=1 Tax=Sulfitobacter undariae TaxID=1563671 RepID=A0A7W6EAG1_9RHOB|nr:DNA-binding IclR family transcriptional regulator [Sulfitobacter undariae]
MNVDTPPVESIGAQSVDRALGLLSLIGRNASEGVNLSVIVADTGLSRPTARRLLLALMRARMVEQDAKNRRYFLGQETYVLGVLAAQRFDLMDLTRDSLLRLAELSGDTVFLSVRRDAYSVCLHKEEGTFPIRTNALQVGHRHPLGVGAGSLAMLAALPAAERAEVLGRNADVLGDGFPDCTPEALAPHIDEAAVRGYALNPGLVLTNSWAVGAAFRTPDGNVAGAISIAAIDSRMGPDRQLELGAALRLEMEKIEKRIEQTFALPASAGLAQGRRRKTGKGPSDNEK